MGRATWSGRPPQGLRAHGPVWAVSSLLLLLLAACPSRDLPPPPESEPASAKDPPSPCGLVFRDPKVRGGSACCAGPSADLLKSADVVAACGLDAAAYLGQTRDGAACRLHFKTTGGDARESVVMVSRPLIPPGAPAPVRPDPLLPWSWKKVALRDALGFQASAASDEAKLLERQTILWAGRGRRIVGLHVSKQVCTDAQAQTLLQKAIDAVP
jgi:hypothetical protein